MFGYAETKDDSVWIKCCTVLMAEGMRLGVCPRKTWWQCFKEYTWYEKFFVYLKRMHRPNTIADENQGAAVNPSSPENRACVLE